MFENVFEVICDHIIHARKLADFPKAKKHNITKVRCQAQKCFQDFPETFFQDFPTEKEEKN